VKIIVIGGTGLIGSKVVTKLRNSGFEAVAASRTSGVDTLTGRGLADVLAKASVVIDLSNPMSRCRSWAQIAFRKAATCARSSRRRS